MCICVCLCECFCLYECVGVCVYVCVSLCPGICYTWSGGPLWRVPVCPADSSSTGINAQRCLRAQKAQRSSRKFSKGQQTKSQLLSSPCTLSPLPPLSFDKGFFISGLPSHWFPVWRREKRTKQEEGGMSGGGAGEEAWRGQAWGGMKEELEKTREEEKEEESRG